MSRARWAVALSLLGALVTAVACSSSRPPADADQHPDGVTPPTLEGIAEASASQQVLYYPGCDPTEITDAALGNCPCYDPDGGGDGTSKKSGITIELPCGLGAGLCGGSNNDLLLCTDQHQGVFFPNCQNIYTGPDGSAVVPACAPGTQPVPRTL